MIRRKVTYKEKLQFVAQTPKDMLQWVACINKRTVTKIEQDILNGGEAVEEENLYEPVKHNDEPDNDRLVRLFIWAVTLIP